MTIPHTLVAFCHLLIALFCFVVPGAPSGVSAILLLCSAVCMLDGYVHSRNFGARS